MRNLPDREVVRVYVPGDLMPAIDQAVPVGLSRSAWVRQLIVNALDVERPADQIAAT